MSQTTYDVICAVDIGQTLTGCAYTHVSDCDVHILNDWENEKCEKTATSVLLNSQGLFEEFGHQAEYKYHKLMSLDQVSGNRLYKFKAQLTDKQSVDRDWVVTSTDDHVLPVMNFLKMTLLFLKKKLHEAIKQTERSVCPEQIQWVIPVPSTWNTEAKEILREAAHQAELTVEKDSDQLILVDEAVAIALYCADLPATEVLSSRQEPVNIQGSKYLVIDAGGSTVSMTVCETTGNGAPPKTILTNCIDNCGGNSVNEAFIQLMQELFGKEHIEEYCKTTPLLWFEQVEGEFEKKKKEIEADGEDMLTLTINENLQHFLLKPTQKSVEQLVSACRHKGVYSKQHDLMLNPTAIFQLYQATLTRLRRGLEDVLQQVKDQLRYVFVVGGFAQSPFVRRALLGSLHKYEVLIVRDAQTALLRAAVSYPTKQITNTEHIFFGDTIRDSSSSSTDESVDEFLAIGESHFDVVCAIDFGTTYSGYAYAEVNSLDSIILNKEWDNNLGLSSLKNSTTVLTDFNGEFEEFGFDAEFKYSKLCSQGDGNGRDLYKHFKMLLHNQQDLSKSTMVESTRGSQRPAIEVFVMALQYLKEHFMTALLEKDGEQPDIDRIRWVITVPAIWSDKAKQFMREAAHQAGLISDVDSHQLIFALEPEAAAFYCQEMLKRERFVDQHVSGQLDSGLPEGTKYMIVDAGGGTVDITVQEVLSNHKIKQLEAPTGGDWGGNRINSKFEELMVTVFGKKFIEKYKISNPDGWLELEIDFEKKKRANTPDGKSTISFAITRSLEKAHRRLTGEDIDDVVQRHKDLGVHISNDKLIMDSSAVFDFYFSVTTNIIPCIQDLVSTPQGRDVKYIFLVGGFAESDYLREAITREFKQHTVLSPEHSGTAVLRGAVIFGHNTEIVSSRVSRKYYGIAVNRPFEEGRHDEEKKTVNEHGQAYCQDLFDAYISKDEVVNVGDFKELNYHPFKQRSENVQLKLYCTDRQDAMYVSDGGVELLTELCVPVMRRGSGQQSADVRFKVYFGGTEIVVESYDNNKPTDVKRASLKCFTNVKPDYAVIPH